MYTKFNMGITKIKSTDFKINGGKAISVYKNGLDEIKITPSTPRYHFSVTLYINGEKLDEHTRIIKGIEFANKAAQALYSKLQSNEICIQKSNDVIDKCLRKSNQKNEICKQKSKETSRGGKRKGAGRKKGEPTKLIRVPVRFEAEIKALIKERKDQKSSS